MSRVPQAKLTRFAGFSMIELVIVVVIIGIIGAIAIPRMSRGAAGAADSALVADLAVLRNAIDLYQAEHGGDYPPLTGFANHLTQFSDETGTTVQATKDASSGVIFGPYLRSIPTLKVGSTTRGENGLTDTPGTAGAGWVYDEATGAIIANTTDTDDRGVGYNTY